MKGLNTVQTLAKVGRVISRVIYICCNIGVVGCIVGGVAMFVAEIATRYVSLSLFDLLSQEWGISPWTVYSVLAVGIILSFGEAVLAKKAYAYFDRELEVGNPFTVSGAHELFMLGVSALWILIVAIVAAEIYQHILAAVGDNVRLVSLDGHVGFVTGTAIIAASLLCRAGAELIEKKTDGAEK